MPVRAPGLIENPSPIAPDKNITVAQIRHRLQRTYLLYHCEKRNWALLQSARPNTPFAIQGDRPLYSYNCSKATGWLRQSKGNRHMLMYPHWIKFPQDSKVFSPDPAPLIQQYSTNMTPVILAPTASIGNHFDRSPIPSTPASVHHHYINLKKRISNPLSYPTRTITTTPIRPPLGYSR